jgi:hypothetical protein
LSVDVAGYDNDQAGRDLAVRDQRDDAGILINGLAIDDASRGFEGACDIGGYYILTTLLQMHVFSLQALQVKKWGVAIFAKACFGHPSPSKQQKLNATANAFGAPDVLRTCHFAKTIDENTCIIALISYR